MNEFTKDRPTSEQLVDLIDNELDITICSDVVHGLDFEYKQLQQENKQLKEINEEHKKLNGKLREENKILKENAEHNDKVVDKVNWENNLLKQQNRKYKKVIDKLKEFIESKNNGVCVINGKEKEAFTFLLDFDKAREFIWGLLDILKEVEYKIKK